MHSKIFRWSSDPAIVLINDTSVANVESSKHFNLNTNETQFSSNGNEYTLDIIVENTGRANFGNTVVLTQSEKDLTYKTDLIDKKFYPIISYFNCFFLIQI